MLEDCYKTDLCIRYEPRHLILVALLRAAGSLAIDLQPLFRDEDARLSKASSAVSDSDLKGRELAKDELPHRLTSIWPRTEREQPEPTMLVKRAPDVL